MALTFPFKAEKALTTVKGAAVITAFTSGAAVAPSANMVAIYIDLAAAHRHRKVEVFNALKLLRDWATERQYERPTVTTRYYRLSLSTYKVKKDIVTSTLNTSIVSGDVAIGIATGLLSAGGKASIPIENALNQLMDLAREKWA